MYKDYLSFVTKQFICKLVACIFPSIKFSMISKTPHNTSVLYNPVHNHDNFNQYGIYKCTHKNVNSFMVSLMSLNTMPNYNKCHRQYHNINIPKVQFHV